MVRFRALFPREVSLFFLLLMEQIFGSQIARTTQFPRYEPWAWSWPYREWQSRRLIRELSPVRPRDIPEKTAKALPAAPSLLAALEFLFHDRDDQTTRLRAGSSRHPPRMAEALARGGSPAAKRRGRKVDQLTASQGPHHFTSPTRQQGTP